MVLITRSPSSLPLLSLLPSPPGEGELGRFDAAAFGQLGDDLGLFVIAGERR